MRLIFSILTAIVVIIAALVFVGPMFISTEELRNQLFARVESMTGYRLRVSGPVDITLFPSIDLVAEDVGVAQPADRGDAEFATAKTLRFSLMLRSLFDGKVRVKTITLVDPVIAIPQKTAAPAAPAAPALAPMPAPGDSQASPAPGGGSSGLARVAEQLKTVTLDKLVIKDGTVILPPSDGAPGKRIEKLNLNASLPDYDKPLSFAVSAVVDGKAYKSEGAIGNFGGFLEGAPAPVRLKVEAPGALDAPASLGGTATYKNDTLTFSQFSAKSGDKTLAGSAVYKDGVATLSQLTGTVGRDTFAGHAVYKDNVVTVRSLRANVRGAVLAGSLTVNLANKVPYVVAAFAAKTLDVNALTGAPKSKPKSKPKPTPTPTAKAKPSSGGGGGGSGGGSKTKANAGKSGWSSARIDFSPLKLVNGKFSLTAEQLIYDHVTLSPVSVQATLNGGKLNASLSKFNLYGGAGNAAIAVDASRKTPTQQVNLAVTKFNAYPLLKDAADFERIEGKGTVNLKLSGVGASQRAIVSSLNGTANLEFVDGAVRGVNIAKMIRKVGIGVVDGWQGGKTEKTDFASLGASFQIAKGQATTSDMHLVGPLVKMTGAGTVNLPAQSLKFRVEPQLVASLEGQGRQGDIAGLGVPVMIVGPWSKPKIYPDIKGILQDPAGAIARFKDFGDGVKKLPGLENIDQSGVLQNVIKDGKVDQDALIQGIGGLLGGTQTAPAPPPPPAQAVPQGAAPAAAQPKPPAQPKQKKKVDAEDIAKDAARQLLNDFLGGR